MTDQYFNRANGIIFTFDLTERDSFNNLHQWVEDLQDRIDKSVRFIVIGNKCDDEDQIAVSERDII